ncbi:MAG: hypothetical protein HYV09_11585 [Deltaproteobacteria bacterium]|nr:hypothetical protein [Deltaproteobacteria bacterium]
MIRVGMGDETIHVPVFRLPYVGGRDGFAAAGGFFVTGDGEYGVVVGGEVPIEQVAEVAAAELRKNLPRLTALVRDQFAKLTNEQRSHMS